MTTIFDPTRAKRHSHVWLQRASRAVLRLVIVMVFGVTVSVSSFDYLLNSVCRKGVPDLHMPDGVVGLSDEDKDTRKNLTINFDFRSGKGSHVICLEEI